MKANIIPKKKFQKKKKEEEKLASLKTRKGGLGKN